MWKAIYLPIQFYKMIIPKLFMNVLVYKTNVKFKKDTKIIGSFLNKISCITKWNFDLEDCDKILRIETNELNINICEQIKSLGFKVEELF